MLTLDKAIKELEVFKGVNDSNGIVGISISYLGDVYHLLVKYKELRDRLEDDCK